MDISFDKLKIISEIYGFQVPRNADPPSPLHKFISVFAPDG